MAVYIVWTVTICLCHSLIGGSKHWGHKWSTGLWPVNHDSQSWYLSCWIKFTIKLFCWNIQQCLCFCWL